nr:MAG TPA: hypothetical protein [Caudoviricetes sp.]
MYDSILCMNVPDTVKSKDARTVDASFNVVYKSNSGTMQALVMAANEKEAEQKVRSREGNKFVSLIGVRKMSDSKTIDKAIRNCDAIPFSVKNRIKNGELRFFMGAYYYEANENGILRRREQKQGRTPTSEWEVISSNWIKEV